MSLAHLSSHLLLLIGNVIYFSDHLLKVGIVTVLALQSPNPCPLYLPGYLLVEGEVDYETLGIAIAWTSTSGNLYSV
jgi:hypothetical protein